MDRIEKKVTLRAPRGRVWRALANSDEFGAWFGMKLDGPFTPGARVRGQVLTPGYEHVVCELAIERVEPERLFSYRWHPHAVDPKVDYSKEPTTLVEMRLDEAPGGTVLTIVESGFEQVPEDRRALAFRMNDQGWAEQAKNLERHVSQP